MLASRVVFTALRRPLAQSVRALATSTPSPYEVLGVSRKAPATEIKAAYLKAAKLSHPDSASSSDGPSFEAVNAAYESLSTPARRSRTDAELDAPPVNLRAEFEDLVLMAEGGQLGKAGAIFQALSERAQTPSDVAAASEAAAALLDACAAGGAWREALRLFEQWHRTGLAPARDDAPPPPPLSPHQAVQLPSRTLVLLDALQRAPPPHGLAGDLLSIEAAMSACERFGLGERLVAVLEAEQERVQEEGRRRADEGDEAEAAGAEREEYERVPRPRGRAPKGKRWDDRHGCWVADGATVAGTAQAAGRRRGGGGAE